MNGYIDPETGYLCINEMSDGVNIINSSEYNQLLSQIEHDHIEIEAKKAEIIALQAQIEHDHIEIESQKVEIVALRATNGVLSKMLNEERNRSDEKIKEKDSTISSLYAVLGALYDRLGIVKKAHYLEGYSDGAWHCRHRELNDVGKELKSAVADFPKLLEDTLLEVKNIIDTSKDLSSSSET